MEIIVREYEEKDVPEMVNIWNEIVAEGTAFPQSEPLGLTDGKEFFAGQTSCGVAESGGKIVGMYILHPNNVGRCGHICNASYAVSGKMRGLHIGESLVRHCMKAASEKGFRILQFNAVVSTNTAALKLYEKLGFIRLGVIKEGFWKDDGTYEDIIPHYINLGNL